LTPYKSVSKVDDISVKLLKLNSLQKFGLKTLVHESMILEDLCSRYCENVSTFHKGRRTAEYWLRMLHRSRKTLPNCNSNLWQKSFWNRALGIKKHSQID